MSMIRKHAPTVLLTLCFAVLTFGAQDKGQKHTVSMKDKKFAPAGLTIKAGDTVVWTNNDEHDHTVVADDGSFKSGNIGAGDTFRHEFKKKGKHGYSCTYHPRMKGSITVE
jgi:plastocyanin